MAPDEPRLSDTPEFEPVVRSIRVADRLAVAITDSIVSGRLCLRAELALNPPR